MPNVLAVIPGHIPSTTINVVKPLAHLHAQGRITFAVRTEAAVMPWHLRGVDVIVACRNADPAYRYIFDYAALCGIPVIYDIDDNLFAVPAYDTFTHHQMQRHKPQLAAYLRGAALVRAHAEALVNVVRDYNPNVRRVFGSIDWALIPDELPPLREKPLEILYPTSRQHGDGLFALLEADIVRALDDLNGRAVLRCIGYHPPTLKHHPHVVFQPYEADYDAYIRHIATYGYALGLAPMPDDAFHRSKTNVKFRDFGAAGIAGVYQRAAVYDEIVHGETGWLVSGEPGSWYAAVMTLVNDRALLERIRRGAQAAVQAHYTLDAAADDWLRDIDALTAGRKTPDIQPMPGELAARWGQAWAVSLARRGYRFLVPQQARVALKRWRLR